MSARAHRSRRRPASPGRVALWGLCTVVLAFLLVPTLLVVPISVSDTDYLEFPPSGLSLRWYEAYFEDENWTLPTLLSLQIALASTVVSTVVGTLAALALARGRMRGRGALNLVIVAPLIAPLIITAVAVFSFYARLRLNGTALGFVLAHTVLTVPYVVLTVTAALQRIDPMLELAAMSLGASRPVAVARVTLPLILPAVLAGAGLAFVTSFDEAVVSFFISGLDATTLPKRMFENIDFNVTPIVAAVSTMLTAMTLALMAVVQLLRMRFARRVSQ